MSRLYNRVPQPVLANTRNQNLLNAQLYFPPSHFDFLLPLQTRSYFTMNPPAVTHGQEFSVTGRKHGNLNYCMRL